MEIKKKSKQKKSEMKPENIHFSRPSQAQRLAASSVVGIVLK